MSKYDLNFFVTRTGDSLWCKAEYCTALFSEDQVRGLIADYETAVDLVAGEPRMLVGEAKHSIGATATASHAR